MNKFNQNIWEDYLPLRYVQKILNNNNKKKKKKKKQSNTVSSSIHQTQKYRVERFFKPISKIV